MLQSASMDLNECLRLLQKIQEFLVKFKDEGFEQSKVAAKELAEELEMTQEEAVFPAAVSMRRKRTKKLFSYEAEDESVHDPEEHYRVGFFNVLTDQAIMSLQERFDQLQNFQSKFGFLFNISALQNCEDKTLRNHCIDLNALLSESRPNASATERQHGNEPTQSSESDIEELNLFTELKTFAHVTRCA